MKSKELFNVLLNLGFIEETIEVDLGDGNYDYNLFNKDGIYLGDILIKKGFVKSENIKNGKTWVEFNKEGEITFGHRKLSEYNTKSFYVR